MSTTRNVVASLLNNGIHGKDGSNGHHGSSGSYGGGRGGNGGRGADGIDGTSSGLIDAFLTTDGVNDILIDYQLGPTSMHQQIRKGIEPLQLGNPQTHLYLSSRGGDGGNGGRGGDGGSGGAGYNGQNATRYSNGTNGGPGGNGGDGGDGGKGGNSGSGNDINIRVNQENMDLLMILKQGVSDTSPGIVGVGGSRGHGGSGGHGGHGGNSYSWSESHTSRDSNGNTTTHYTHHTNPGGFSGPNGHDGHNGHNGADGISGTAGVYSIFLNTHESGTVRYEAPYDLHVEKINFNDTVGYGIIEPDSHVRLMVQHKNVGGMPTPSHQNIMSFVGDNQWVDCPIVNRVEMQRWITEKSSVYLPRDIIFHIKDYRQDIYRLPRSPFIQHSTMDHQCLVDRVNQYFSRVAATKSPFQIEYPVQTSLIKGLDCVTMQDEAPFVYSIWNKSLLSIGSEANTTSSNSNSPNRILFTTIRINLNTRGGNTSINPSDIVIRDLNGNAFNNPEAGLYSQVSIIDPSDLKFVSATLSFVNPDIKPYTRVLLESTLYLGHIKDMMLAQPIQSRPFEVQLSEGYLSSLFNCDILLVVNNQSEYDEITQWKILAHQLGKSLNIWNSGLYQGFQLNHRKADGRSLLQDFRGKTIVYLDNNFVKDELLYPASEHIRSKEFLNAAYHHGIHVLLVGKNFNIEKEIFPINTFERATLVYYKEHKQLLNALKHQIPSGTGCAQVIPPHMAVPDNGDLSLFLLVNKKHEQFIIIFRQLSLLSLFSKSNSLYPLKSISLDTFTLSELSSTTDSKDELSFGFTLKIQHLDFEIHFSTSKLKDKKEKSSIDIQQFYQSLNQIKALSSTSTSNPINQTINDLGAGSGGERKSVGPISTMIIDDNNLFSGYLECKFKSNSSFSKLFFELSMDKKVLHQCQVKDGKRVANSKAIKILNLKRFSLTRGNQFGSEKENHLSTFQLVTPETTWFFKTKNQDDYQDWLSRLSPMSIEYPTTYCEPSSFVKDQIILKKEDARGIHLSPRSPINEEKHIPIIQVTKRYIISKPKEKDLIEYAKSLSNKLNSRFPNQRNIVVYEFAPKEKSGWKKMTLGNVELHRSLDQIEPHIAKLNIDQDAFIHSPTIVQTPSTIYHLFKVFDFREKLTQLDVLVSSLGYNDDVSTTSTTVLSHISSQSKLGLLILSICSDLAEEQYWFREGSNWRDKLSVEKIKLNLLKLNILKRFQFKSYNDRSNDEEGSDDGGNTTEELLSRISLPISDLLIEIGVHLKIMIENFKKNFADKICLRRRANDVDDATLSLWNDIQSVHILNKPLKDDKPSSKGKGGKVASEVIKAIKDLELKKLDSWQEYLYTQHSNGSWGYFSMKADSTKNKKEKRWIKKSQVIASYRKPPFTSVTSVIDCDVTLPSVLSKQSFLSNYVPPIQGSSIVEERTIFGENKFARQQFINRIASEKLGCNPDNAITSQLQVYENYSPLFINQQSTPVLQLEKQSDLPIELNQSPPPLQPSIPTTTTTSSVSLEKHIQVQPDFTKYNNIIGDHVSLEKHQELPQQQQEEQQQQHDIIIPSSTTTVINNDQQQQPEQASSSSVPSSPNIIDEASKHQNDLDNNIHQNEKKEDIGSELNNNDENQEIKESINHHISEEPTPLTSSSLSLSTSVQFTSSNNNSGFINKEKEEELVEDQEFNDL